MCVFTCGCQGDAKIGALLSGLVGVVVYGISRVFDFSHEDVGAEAEAQLQEEVSVHWRKACQAYCTALNVRFSFACSDSPLCVAR